VISPGRVGCLPVPPDPDRTASATDLDDLTVLGNVNIPMSGRLPP
jgi:hypothetical protein